MLFKPENQKNKWKRAVKAAATALILTGAMQAAPVYADTVHTAKGGDTFYFLAKQYGVQMDKLMRANPEIEATNIYEGLKITIPDVGDSIESMGKSTNNNETINISNNRTASATTASVEALSALKVFSEDKVVQTWGKTFNYSSTIKVKATAYSAAASENGKWGAVDYFGNPLKLGTIAVDPNVIPMGTKVLVTGHSHPHLPKNAFVATATDQGGAIKGNKIDIFIPGSPAKVREFGIQDITLYVIE